ncbi:MAG: ABC transporter ATP-binding protein [Ignavibacterium sp.]
MDMAILMIEVHNLSKSFDAVKILDEISFDVKNSENLIVFGKSGSGKSVLLKCLIGLLAPDEGEIFLMGKPTLKLNLKELNELRKEIGFLFQGAALYDSMTVRENLSFPLIKNFHLSKKEINDRVYEVLEMVSLTEQIDKMPSELSGGMRKRIGLARAIITRPKLMFYDEPTTGLDPITSKEISRLIRNLQNDLKMTSIVVTHDLICAEIIADRAIVLKDGKIEYQGKLHELTNSSDPFLKDFFSFDFIESGGK